MQMDIDADAVAVRDAKDDIKMSIDIAVISGRIESADQIGAGANRRVQQFGGSG